MQNPETEKKIPIVGVDVSENETSRDLRDDFVAMEEPMEIRVVFGPADQRKDRSLSITMRTPDFDFELAAGFLLSEGIVSRKSDIDRFEFCGPVAEGREQGNIVRVELASGVELDIKSLQRHFYTTSSCGICGKGSLDALQTQGLKQVGSDNLKVPAVLICRMPEILRESQSVFHRTGGIHAAGLFDASGKLLLTREDIGRHNAVDKLLGNQLLAGNVPLENRVLVVSGRASFELVQKAVVGGIALMVAVGAPSSLAVRLACEFDMTLIGFTSNKRFNIYTKARRISFD